MTGLLQPGLTLRNTNLEMQVFKTLDSAKMFWRRVDFQEGTEVSEKHDVFIFIPEDWGSVSLLNAGTLLTHPHGVTTQKTNVHAQAVCISSSTRTPFENLFSGERT